MNAQTATLRVSALDEQGNTAEPCTGLSGTSGAGLGWCLSKGFREGALLPNGLLRIVLKLEDLTNPLWSRLGGLNAMILIERVKPGKTNRMALEQSPSENRRTTR